MKVAIVHDYIKEYGGAERVLEALCEIYPDAPIYTAFYKKGSPAWEKFKNRKINASWVQNIPFFVDKLHSPLRFLTPQIWGSFSAKGRPAFGWDLSGYDVILSSASWYVTKGFGTRGTSRKRPIEICYCHTPPRWLYGYKTSIEWQKFWPIKMYGMIIGHFMRMYDFRQAQKVDFFIANSEEVKSRIKKFYRRDATVIYPPVNLENSKSEARNSKQIQNTKYKIQDDGYYFIVARIVGGKGLDLAVSAAEKLGFKLKIAGVSSGYYTGDQELKEKKLKNVEFLGSVTDEELVKLYAGAKAFLALATDEDFGITPVEAMLCGTPVIAFYGGGYKETVIDGKTGVFFKESNVESLTEAVKKFETLRQAQGKKMSEECIKQAENFSKERFVNDIKKFINAKMNT